jgi:hypothetical protein
VDNPGGQITQDATGDQTVVQTPTIYGAPGGTFQINAGDSALTLEADGVSGQTFAFTDNTGTLVIGIDQLATIDIPASGTVFTAEANPNLGLHLIGGFAGTISGLVAGDAIVVDTTAAATFVVNPGNSAQILVQDTIGGAPEGTLTFANATLASLAATTPGALVDVACFAAETLIETAAGPRPVEALCVGDAVVTADGRCEPVVWVGSRAVDCTRHPRPETVWPVRVRAGAFGENVPVRDLFLSPDHAVFVNGVLVPVKLLVNGTSIAQVKRNRVRYYHVELPEHTVILAEGLAVESYLDLGDRANFGRSGETVRLFPDFATRLAPETALAWETRGAAPLVMAGEQLTAARWTVLENAPRSRPGSAQPSSQAG